MTRQCPALIVSAPASGQGKTLVTAALARRHRAAGRRVRVFKTGPDFLDPMILERASGAPVYQLDLFMGGADDVQALLHAAADQADLILIEGVMGLFDGDPSAADLAALLQIPVLAVIDGSAMAQSFGALAHGLASYRDDVTVAGVLANRVAGERHADMLRESLVGETLWMGALMRDPEIGLPERHLGLVQALEVADLDARLDRAAAALPGEAEWLPPPASFAGAAAPPPPPLLAGATIAVARDAAFAFVYRANCDLLEAIGARLRFFSPLADRALPACDALWFPGGYPELHLDTLAANAGLLTAIRDHHAAEKPILAECGGMLYCARTLTDADGRTASMAGLLPADAFMQRRLAGLGLQEAALPEGRLRGHSFHYSKVETALEPLAVTRNPNGGRGEHVHRLGSLTASYAHFYFPSNPEAIAALFLGRVSPGEHRDSRAERVDRSIA